MAQQSIRIINGHAGWNDTWLAPYVGKTVRVVKYVNGRVDLWLDGHRYNNCEGGYCAKNGWYYTVFKLLNYVKKIK